ncbi:MAG: hybrid sensor histidine kinase/response regulator, partial [Proteobacteria bacterium]|nr:hybrid sensor histidine kinase/response regulator [Pseudomonadota bacterium]
MLNARDAMPDGGVVTITTANVSLNQTDIQHDMTAGEYVKLSVSDTGQGFSREALERAFDPFYTTKEVGQGSGLGLSMVYGFSQQSGGHAEIESVEGQGATVSIYLPRDSEGQPMPPAPVDPVMPPGKGETILVVEDEDR